MPDQDELDDENERELARAFEEGLLFTFHVAVDGPPPVDRVALGRAILEEIRPGILGTPANAEGVEYIVTGLEITRDKR